MNWTRPGGCVAALLLMGCASVNQYGYSESEWQTLTEEERLKLELAQAAKDEERTDLLDHIENLSFWY